MTALDLNNVTKVIRNVGTIVNFDRDKTNSKHYGLILSLADAIKETAGDSGRGNLSLDQAGVTSNLYSPDKYKDITMTLRNDGSFVDGNSIPQTLLAVGIKLEELKDQYYTPDKKIPAAAVARINQHLYESRLDVGGRNFRTPRLHTLLSPYPNH